MKNLVLPDDLRHQNTFSLGGKARHLWQMQQAGLPVPPFFVIPAETTAAILQPIRYSIAAQLSKVNGIDDPKLQEAAQQIQAQIQALAFPVDLVTAIHQTSSTLFGKIYQVAVRSSSAAEDGTTASFAGQHRSYLFVPPDQLIAKIRACIASAWNFGALAYRLANDLTLQDIQYAVIVQQMIDASSSGVGFSMDLSGNLADSIIVAGYGLGEGIVNDQVETDTYTINRQNRGIRKTIPVKRWQVSHQMGGGTVALSLPATLQQAQVLSDTEISQVFDLTIQAEKLLGTPADVEFSFDQQGILHILQMRPITTIDLQRIEILDNTNIVESYPGVTLPLTFSFAVAAYEKVFAGSAKAFWVSEKVVREQATVFQDLLAHYCGRIYYRLDNWYKMVSLVHSSASSLAAWEKAVGLAHSEKGKVKFQLRNRLKTLASMIWLLLNYRRGNQRFFKIFSGNYQYLRSFKSYRQDPEKLWQHYEVASSRLFQPWYLTLVNDFLAFKFFGRLQDLVTLFQLPDPGSLANDLLCGTGGVESEVAILHTLQLKEKILSDPDLMRLFEKPPQEILTELKHGYAPEFQERFEYHLEYYGDRTLAELKLETPSLRRAPQAFIQLLKNQLSTTVTIKDFQLRQSGIRQKAEATIRAYLPWWNPKTYLFLLVRRIAAYGIKTRENMRFCRTRAYGAVKDIFLEVGHLMVMRNVINRVEDVFYLSLPELRAFCLEGAGESKVKQIAELKNRYAQFEAMQPPERVIYQSGQLPLIHLQKPNTQTMTGCLQGLAVSRGTAVAEAAVILQAEPHLQVHGKILVSQMTDPGWVFLMMQAAGLVSEKGSLLSHTAIVGRELGIPVVVGVTGATSIFQTGDILKMDGSLGTVEKISSTF